MSTLILTPRHSDDSQALWRAALTRGWDVRRLATWRVPDDLRSVAEPVLYVEALFGPTLAEQLGVRLLGPEDAWLPELPMTYRKREIVLSTLGSARKLSTAHFVKPPNDKSFPGAVYAPADLPAAFDDDLPVLVSEPVTFLSEFRCFILQRRCRTFSLYARRGDLVPPDNLEEAETRELLEFIGTILRDRNVELPDACALDVGVIEGRGWGAVELNAAWGAGIYGCDPNEVLDVLQAATVADEEARPG